MFADESSLRLEYLKLMLEADKPNESTLAMHVRIFKLAKENTMETNEYLLSRVKSLESALEAIVSTLDVWHPGYGTAKRELEKTQREQCMREM